VVFLYSGTTYTYTGEDEIISEGETVTKGETLFYLMINRTYCEVLSDRDGKVRKMLVKRGDKVRKGDPLVEFE